VICDRYKCTYSDVAIKCSSITDNQSLKLSKVYSSLFVDFYKLLGHLFRRHLVYSSFVYHTVLMQTQLWIVLQKRAFLCPVRPVQQGQRGQLPPRFRRLCISGGLTTCSRPTRLLETNLLRSLSASTSLPLMRAAACRPKSYIAVTALHLRLNTLLFNRSLNCGV